MSRVVVLTISMLVLAGLIVLGGSYFVFALVTRGPLSGETNVDYGNVQVIDGKPVQLTHVFHLTNTRNHPIAIKAVTADCGCTTMDVSKDPIAPGKSIDIKTVTMFGARGTKTVKVHLVFDDDSLQFLRITGYGIHTRSTERRTSSEDNTLQSKPVEPPPDLDFSVLHNDVPATAPESRPAEEPPLHDPLFFPAESQPDAPVATRPAA
ncbi:MAG TPA: DUF1573 domain-containing protein [Phycisphaerales bacterium]|nr:DUF1573 domain-containing protein [Phycisphaerales bacterium]